MGKYSEGVTLCTPDRDIVYKSVISGFVDDNNSTVMVEEIGNQEVETIVVMEKLRKMAQAWERILYATGGALSLPKCFYSVLDWKWVKVLL